MAKNTKQNQEKNNGSKKERVNVNVGGPHPLNKKAEIVVVVAFPTIGREISKQVKPFDPTCFCCLEASQTARFP